MLHSGLKLYEIDTYIPIKKKTLFPTSLGVSEWCKQMNERSGAREQSEQCGASE